MRVEGSTIVTGVVGRPVRGSLSPIIHNAWIRSAGVDGVYVAFEIADEPGFNALVNAFRGSGSVRGVNVTTPFKEAALAGSDRASPEAREAGAANLLLFEADGTVSAGNTDGHGLLQALSLQSGFAAEGAVAAILGAGGAAKGAAATLIRAGAERVRIVNRTLERAEALAASLGARAEAFAWSDLRSALAGAGLLVNATTLGRLGGEPLEAPIGALPGEAVVMDMIYRPLRTGLLAEAKAQGLRTVDGLAMLIAQAEPSFEAFFGAPAPRDVDVRALALEALG